VTDGIKLSLFVIGGLEFEIGLARAAGMDEGREM
jgi:hypothetical protein